MLVVGRDVSFGKYGTAKVTLIDPNVTPESQKRRETEILRVAQSILDRKTREREAELRRESLSLFEKSASEEEN